LPPACRLPSSALADPGNGNGGEGHGNSNDHDHENNGNSPNGNSGKGKDADDDDSAAVRHGGAVAEAERSGRDYVPDEMVVANLGDDAKFDIGRLGFVVLDEQQLASLGLTITRLRVPRRMTAPAARTLLATQYPGVVVDLNANYRPQRRSFMPAAVLSRHPGGRMKPQAASTFVKDAICFRFARYANGQ
jgi:hypothetical protein